MNHTLARSTLNISQLNVRRSANFSLRIPILHVRPGRVTCLVGANGCGKTTLLETILGLVTPQRGSITIANQPLVPHANDPYLKRMVGYVPDDENWIIPELTAPEYIALLATIFAKAGVQHDTVAEAQRVAHALGFTQDSQQLASLSHGNKKKVQIIAAFMHQPRLLIIDELRNGLDPIAIQQAEALVSEQRKKGAAVLAATHDLWWAERFADDIVMIQNGRMLLHATTADIVSSAGSVEAKFMELYNYV